MVGNGLYAQPFDRLRRTVLIYILKFELNEIQNNAPKLCNCIFSVHDGICVHLWRQNNGQQIRALERHHRPDIFTVCFCSVISRPDASQFLSQNQKFMDSRDKLHNFGDYYIFIG